MDLYDIVFYFFGVIVLASAWVVVSSRNIVYSAFALLFTFFGVAGLYVLLSADFLAVAQVLIYVGGILVLLLFGVMLTNKVVSVDMNYYLDTHHGASYLTRWNRLRECSGGLNVPVRPGRSA